MIEVIGSRSRVRLPAIIDMGFSDELSLPTDIAVGLGLELVDRQRVVLADGSMRTELEFSCRVQFLDEEREVNVYLTELDEALIGTALLRDCRLTIDFKKERVSLKRLKG
jgi:clan AA aspartic protease